ncbi:MAG TPA: hypothetical protein VHB77_00300 [Planctomycetaceae bacterium]|nr:hypothetical protein [Planctomycetaceae bacterium]
MREIAKMCVAGFLGAAIALSLGAKPSGVQEEVITKKFALVDDSGKFIATFQNDNGEPKLTLGHPDHSGGVSVNMKDGGGLIYLTDRAGKNKIAMTVNETRCFVGLACGDAAVDMRTDEEVGMVTARYGSRVEAFLVAADKGSTVGCAGADGKETVLKPPMK